MAFNVKLYWVSDDPKCITKSLIDSGTNANLISSMTSVTFKQGHDLRNLTVTARVTSIYRPYDRVNYIKVEKSTTGTPRPWDMERYYFVENVTTDPAGMTTFKCRLDVLMTYASQIKALNVTLDRSETIYNGYLPDSDYTALGYRSITCRAFDKGLTTNSFILMTTG